MAKYVEGLSDSISLGRDRRLTKWRNACWLCGHSISQDLMLDMQLSCRWHISVVVSDFLSESSTAVWLPPRWHWHHCGVVKCVLVVSQGLCSDVLLVEGKETLWVRDLEVRLEISMGNCECWTALSNSWFALDNSAEVRCGVVAGDVHLVVWMKCNTYAITGSSFCKLQYLSMSMMFKRLVAGALSYCLL